MKKFALVPLLALLMVIGLSGCGQGNVAYAPVAYGQNNQCYYVDDPQEAIVLQQRGLCGPTGNYWVPTVMPLLWHQMYYPYYSSPAYYNTYVPVAVRTVYVSHETTFSHQYSSQIKTESAKAKYKGSDGKTYTGNKVKPGKFSNGTKGFGSGKKCSMAAASLPLSFIAKGGGSGGGTSGGRSGGSRFGGGTKGRSGGGNKGSTSGGSKTKGGC